MSRKIARTFFGKAKRTMLVTLPLVAFMSFSCGDDKEDEPENPKPEETVTIIGKWQKYQIVNDDGSLSGGDPDEFWIFEKNNNFSIEDGGEITDMGTYRVDGKMLIIKQYSVSDPNESEELRGVYEIKDGYMNYQFTVVGEGYSAEYRMRKVD